MAEAGERGSRRMGQPPGAGDQLFQLRALIAFEQLDHARDLRALAGRRRCWCGYCAPSRRHICCGIRFRRFLVRVLRHCRVGYGLRTALIGGDRLQSRVGQLQRIRLACFLVASPGFHSGIRFDLAHEAGSQKLGNDLLPSRGFRVFGGMRERSLRCDASDRIANCVSESLAGEFIGIIPLGLSGAIAVTTASPGPETSRRGRRIQRSTYRRGNPQTPGLP